MNDISNCRSFLYVPCNQQKYMEKIPSTTCDAVIFDLEDSVRLADKKQARKNLLGFGFEIVRKAREKVFLVRVNAVDSTFAEDDIRAAVSLKADGIVLPKSTARQVESADTIIQNSVDDGQDFVIIPLIETALGVQTIWETVNASPRVKGAQFGAEDFTRDIQVERTSSGKEIEYARNRMAIACRAKNIAAIDTPFANFKDPEGLAEDTRNVKSMGMTGKTCIHPSQIDVVNSVFTPSEKEVSRARKIVNCWENHGSINDGVIVIEGEMVDRPIYQRAKNLLEKYNKKKENVV
ncbi:MAG: HpcH/HpaI aldolase/citrate lyase family protein [Spirochaetaceae bacterium JB067]